MLTVPRSSPRRPHHAQFPTAVPARRRTRRGRTGRPDRRLTAHATAEFGCINGGSNHPQAANKETISSDVVATASIEPKNGRVVATLKTAAPKPGSFSCPSGQKLVLGSVSYDDIELKDTTNGTAVSLPDASRTFLAF